MTSQTRRELYGIAEIADAINQPRQLVTMWRRRRSHDMPEPDAELASGPVWLGGTIEPWINAQLRLADRRAGAVPLDSADVRKVGRRLLRLAALLLEDRRRPRLIRQAIGEVTDLLPAIKAAEQDATAAALWEVVMPLTTITDDPDALIAALVARLGLLAEKLGENMETLTKADPADDG